MMLLGGLYTNDETLVGAVESLLQQRMRQTDSVQPNPALIVISYRRREGKATDVVVQLFRRPEQTTEVVEAHTRLASRLGPEVLRPLDEWLNLIREPQIVYLGPEEEAGLRQRAFDAALQADLTLMHEQTIEPLHLIILIADTKQLLPQSLSHRVRSVIVEAVLAYGEWQGRIHLVTADPDVAEELEWFLASLREMAMSVARISASVATHPAARRALEAVTLTAQGKEVLATGSVPSPLGMEVATRLTGWAAEQVAWKDQPKMVTICQRGQTQQVRPLELSASLASGAHLGPCH
jgi:hypothetical protein